MARRRVRSLRDEGLSINEIEFDGRDWERATAETEQAMRDGFDIVYQAVFAYDESCIASAWASITASGVLNSWLTEVNNSVRC